MEHENSILLQQLSKHLFWDVNIDDIDIRKHQKFIIERIVKRGNLKDFRLLLKSFNNKVIIQNIIKIRSLDTKTLVFLSSFFDVDKNKFRCYN